MARRRSPQARAVAASGTGAEPGAVLGASSSAEDSATSSDGAASDRNLRQNRNVLLYQEEADRLHFGVIQRANCAELSIVSFSGQRVASAGQSGFRRPNRLALNGVQQESAVPAKGLRRWGGDWPSLVADCVQVSSYVDCTQQWLATRSCPCFSSASPFSWASRWSTFRRRAAISLVRDRSGRTQETFVEGLAPYGFDPTLPPRPTVTCRSASGSPSHPADRRPRRDLGWMRTRSRPPCAICSPDGARVSPRPTGLAAVTVVDVVRCIQASPRRVAVARRTPDVLIPQDIEWLDKSGLKGHDFSRAETASKIKGFSP